jgi:hypothetical protein
MLTNIRRLLLLTFILGLPGFFAGGLYAQSTGAITGIVSDSTGAAIPNATVTVASPATGFTRTVQTNGSGNFTFPDLPIGAYTMTIAKTGFATQKRSATELLTGQTIGLNVSLAVGSNTQTIEVTTDTQQIQTDTSEVATTVDKTQMQDLPLNQRNPIQLTSLTPGAVLTSSGTESGQQDQTGISVNGLRATENNIQLDGSLYENRFLDSVPTLPSPDALQEFTIQATNYSAAYAGAGALVQLSSRSGTNKLHGDAFEFIRNTVLDAYNHFPVKNPLTGALINPPFKLNQFGGTIGGPIVIPHIYNGRDKTFFFFSAEDLQRRSSPTTATIYVPTAAMIGGDFSALTPNSVNGNTCAYAVENGATGTTCKQLYNPTTQVAYANNQITTAINPLSKALYNTYLGGLGADPVDGKVIVFQNQNIDSTQYLIKIDHAVTSKNHFSGRYFYDENNFQRAFSAPLGFFGLNLYRNQSLSLSDTQIFSNTLTATFYASAGRFARTQIPEAPGLKSLQDLGATGVPLGTNVPIFPGIRANISGFVDVFSGGALTQDPTTFEYKGQAVKLLGHHTLTFGVAYERTDINANDYSYTPGDNTFNGSRTQSATATGGSALADFYLGLDSAFYQDNGRKFYLRENRPSAFLQDDWKATSNLTFNAGLRWDPWLPPIDRNDTLVGFIPGRQSTVAPGAPVGLVFNGDAGITQAIFHNNWKDFAPRIGFAYNVSGKGDTVIRGAYGIFYGFPEGLLYQRTDATQPIDLYYNINSPTATWDNIYAGNPGGDPFPRAHVSPSQFGTYTFLLPVSGGMLNPNAHVAYTQDYNLTIQQKLPGNYALSVAYVGNHAEHVMASRQFNPATCPAPLVIGTTCTSNGTNENNRRIYQGLGAVELADSYEWAEYNSLQVDVTHRVSRGLSLLANFVYSKTIDNGSSGTEGQAGPSNPFNYATTVGPADFDQKIRANISANYMLPKFGISGFAGEFVNGWQVNAILQSQSGLPFTITSGTDRSYSGIGNDYGDYVPGVSVKRPAGANFLNEYFNTAAFTPAALGTFGDVHRNSLFGPGYEELDGSIFKDIFPSRRIHGQFRAEGFNLFNHANYANPTSALNSGNFGKITATATSTGTGTTGLNRVFQFGAKVIF